MGILDWLTDIGSSGMTGGGMAADGVGAVLPPNAPSPSPPLPADAGPKYPPLPAAEPPAPSPVPMPQPRPAEADAAQPPIPLPQPRPPGADAPSPMPQPMPQPRPAAAPPAPGPAPTPGPAPGPPMPLQSDQPPGGGLTPPDQGGTNPSLLRAMGINPATADKMRSGLSAGLKAAGESAGKSPFQAFSSGAGAGLEGQEKQGDKTYDQKIKYLQAAIQAQSAGDKAAYNKNYAAYLTGKLKNDTEKAASADSGKKGAWNKPDSQKFIDAQHALSNDPEIRASQKLLEQTAKTGDPADVAKAAAAHNALIQQKQGQYLTGVGLNPQKLQEMQKNPPGTQGNPHVVTSKEDFDQYVKPGDAFVNPKDGKVYIRKGGAASAGGESPAAASPSSPLAPPGPAPGMQTEE